VLLLLVRLMAPFTPFLAESMWRNLRHLLDEKADLVAEESVHYLMMPKAE
jgi:isoleucyl-tRNA synthetase